MNWVVGYWSVGIGISVVQCYKFWPDVADFIRRGQTLLGGYKRAATVCFLLVAIFSFLWPVWFFPQGPVKRDYE